MLHSDAISAKGAKAAQASKGLSRETSEERSWVHLRTIELYKLEYGVTGVVDVKLWTPFSRQAREEWDANHST